MAQEHTRDELYERARRLDISGRSRMSKEELAIAVQEREQSERALPHARRAISCTPTPPHAARGWTRCCVESLAAHIEPLRRWFNAGVARPRFVAILSPT